MWTKNDFWWDILSSWSGHLSLFRTAYLKIWIFSLSVTANKRQPNLLLLKVRMRYLLTMILPILSLRYYAKDSIGVNNSGLIQVSLAATAIYISVIDKVEELPLNIYFKKMKEEINIGWTFFALLLLFLNLIMIYKFTQI